MIFKLNRLFWDENEKSGHRQVQVFNNEDKIAVLNSTRTDGQWTCTFVPMGFSFKSQDMLVLAECCHKCHVLMSVLQAEVLTVDEVQEAFDAFLEYNFVTKITKNA